MNSIQEANWGVDNVEHMAAIFSKPVPDPRMNLDSRHVRVKVNHDQPIFQSIYHPNPEIHKISTNLKPGTAITLMLLLGDILEVSSLWDSG